MTRRIPLTPTFFVAAAAATMVALGVWQLGKVSAQNDRLARYALSSQKADVVPFPLTPTDVDRFAYRRSELDCRRGVGNPRAVAGRNDQAETGYVQIVQCELANGEAADVQLGWSGRPNEVAWSGGRVGGIIEPLRTGFAKLVADPPQAGLEPNAAPDPEARKIDHLAYAGQWFFFALTALVIYWLALRRRWREG